MKVDPDAVDRLIGELQKEKGRSRLPHTLPPPPTPPNLPTQPAWPIPSPMGDGDLKPRVDFLHTAFLWLTGALVVAIGTLVTIGVSLSNASNARTDKLIESLSKVDREVGVVGTRANETNDRLNRIEGKIDRIVERK